MVQPFVSICIPSYNRTTELNRLLLSVDCNPSNIEIVICEDNSPRQYEIRELVKNFTAKSVYRVRYIENKVNLGFDGNLRKLVDTAQGVYIVFMGDDDFFIPKKLDKFILFLKHNLDKAYVLRSHITEHSDGAIEYFRYLPKSQTFLPGEKTVAWLIKRSVSICGFTISRVKALKFKTQDLDGTLLYQVYLMAQVCLKYNSIYYNEPFVHNVHGCRNDNPMFGNSEFENARYTSGTISENNSINFTKSYFELTNYLDNKYGTNLTNLVLLDLSKYSYPILSIQRKRGIKNFLRYAKRLEKEVGLGFTVYYHLYKWGLVFLGEKVCDKIIIMIKRIVGHTPNF